MSSVRMCRYSLGAAGELIGTVSSKRQQRAQHIAAAEVAGSGGAVGRGCSDRERMKQRRQQGACSGEK